jgi:hypothetical protein
MISSICNTTSDLGATIAGLGNKFVVQGFDKEGNK